MIRRPGARRIKIRGGHLGPFLCWAIVFADIGTSVYYVPGILSPQFGRQSALFVAATMGVFILLAIKYAEVAWRYPEGGGVVTVASRAIHPYAGLVGGLLILVDYFLTASLSALSGVLYLGVVAPTLSLPLVSVAVTVIAILALGGLNAIGIKDSARVSAVAAILAAATQLTVVVVVAVNLGPGGIVDSFRALASGAHLRPLGLLTGYAAAFLAFSGLESIAQLAPAMREPRRKISRHAMIAVVLTIGLTSPLLTLWSTTLLPSTSDPNQFVSLLGAHVGGALLGQAVAVAGAVLLVLAANTAIIGAYHVFIALARMGFLPRVLEHRNAWRSTPHWAILLAVAIPVAVVVATGANTNLLGDLYAFGLLGAFVLTCAGLDLVRWRDNRSSGSAKDWASFALGVFTTLAVAVAWGTNIVSKPLATAFGGGLTLLGLLVGFFTYRHTRRSRPTVFPIHYQPREALASIASGLHGLHVDVLAVLPRNAEAAAALIQQARDKADQRSLAFLFRGAQTQPYPEFLEVNDPYLKDFDAQEAFARAESMSRKVVPQRHYVYLPGNLRNEVIGEVWKELRPKVTFVAEEDQKYLPALAIGRIRRHIKDGSVVMQLMATEPAPRAAVIRPA